MATTLQRSRAAYEKKGELKKNETYDKGLNDKLKMLLGYIII